MEWVQGGFVALGPVQATSQAVLAFLYLRAVDRSTVAESP